MEVRRISLCNDKNDFLRGSRIRYGLVLHLYESLRYQQCLLAKYISLAGTKSLKRQSENGLAFATFGVQKFRHLNITPCSRLREKC